MSGGISRIVNADDMDKAQEAALRLIDARQQLEMQVAAVRALHQPKLYDKYSRETAERVAAVLARCPECSRSVPIDKGCKTFEVVS